MAIVNTSHPAPSDRVPALDAASRRRASILVVDDEAGVRNFLQRALSKQYGLVEAAESVEVAQAVFQRFHFDLLIVDVRLPGRSGLEWIQELRGSGYDVDVIFITAYADLDTSIGALRSGAADFILKPFRLDCILGSVERCFERRRLAIENTALRHQVHQFTDRLYGAAGIIGRSERMKQVCELIQRVAPTPSSVLIEGETGTGKELAACAIHRLSGRSGSFVPVNCVAIAPDLFESELFGHTKGAFTGAHQPRQGLFNHANGGTLFLDEIGEMPSVLQAKLLRVIEGRKVRPVGSDREVPVDVRVLAATNCDLEQAVRRGSFREDLFYRLNIVTVRMPSLREHPEDIPELVRFFVDALVPELGVKALAVGQEDMRRLQAYHWPGNVRELRNAVERALLLGRFPREILSGEAPPPASGSAPEPRPPGFSVELSLAQVERQHMVRVLRAAGGNKSEAARRLGISRKTMERKLRSWSDAAK